MNKKAATTIDAYIPAAHLMVKAHSETETLNEAVECVQNKRPDFQSEYLRLIWLGVNAKNNEINQTQP
jgi:hypothetical protein